MATVVGLFDSTSQAQTAVEQLRAGGVTPSDISVAMRTGEAVTTDVVETDTGNGGGIVTGAVGGGVLGGLAGLLVGIGAITIPGVGPLAVGGPLATTLIGAGVGAAAGGLVGALVDAGVPEEEAKLYETGVQRGGVLVTARVPDGQERMALDIMNSNGARDVRSDSAMYSDPNWTYGTTTRDTTYSGYRDTGDDKTNEALGGAGGAVAGGVIGAAVAGPPGAVAGAAIGGAGGAMAADAAEGDRDKAGSGTGAAGGAVAGGLVGGAVGGPIGAAAGAAVGGAAGAAGGENVEEEIEGEGDRTITDPNDPNYRRTY